MLFDGLKGNRAASLEGYLQRKPNNYGKLRKSGLFRTKNKQHLAIVFREKGGRLFLIEADKPHMAGAQSNGTKGKIHAFVQNVYPANDAIHVSDVSDLEYIQDSGTRVASENEEIMDRLDILYSSHELTQEYAMMQCLRGAVVSASGNMLININEEFEVDRPEMIWDLTATAEQMHITEYLDALQRHMRKHLQGQTMTGIDVLCTPAFIRYLKKNASYNLIFEQSQYAKTLVQDHVGGATPVIIPGYESIHFYEYDAEGPVLKADGTSEMKSFLPEPTTGRFAGKGMAVAYPRGLQDSFILFRGPAQRWSTLNKAPTGTGIWSKLQRSEDETMLNIWTEAVWLPFNKDPLLTVDLFNGKPD